MGLADTYEHGIARGVVRYARTRPGWRLHGYGWMFRPLAALEHWAGDGIIARVESRRDADRLASLGLPVVDVAGAYVWSGFHRVTNDDPATGRQAAEYLSSCGFDRFAYAGVPGVGWSEGRKSGFAAALGIQPRDLPVFEESLPWWESRAEGRLAAWVKRLRPPVGLFACNDTAGLKLTELCRRLAIRVPDDLAILGVDNEDILCELSVPTLSSVSLDLEGIGYQAAALLDHLLDRRRSGGTRRAVSQAVGPRQTVERESTRVFTCADPLVEQAVRLIRARTAERLLVATVVAALPTSRRNLELRFRRAVGHTLHDEIVRVRLDRARTLLRSTQDRITDIALACGFGTPQRFHSAFRVAEGCSPARYRRAQRSARG
jgi:LacI family transcriptional regulator